MYSVGLLAYMVFTNYPQHPYLQYSIKYKYIRLPVNFRSAHGDCCLFPHQRVSKLGHKALYPPPPFCSVANIILPNWSLYLVNVYWAQPDWMSQRRLLFTTQGRCSQGEQKANL